MNENKIINKLEAKFDVGKFKTQEFWYYPLLKTHVYFNLTYKATSKSSIFSTLKTVLNAFVKSVFNTKNKKKTASVFIGEAKNRSELL